MVWQEWFWNFEFGFGNSWKIMRWAAHWIWKLFIGDRLKHWRNGFTNSGFQIFTINKRTSSYWCVKILNLGLLINSWNHEVNSSKNLKTFCRRPIKTLAKVCQFDFTPLPHLWHEKWMLVGPITVTFGYVAYKIVAK